MRKPAEYALLFLKLIFWVFAVISIYWLILKLTHHSPSVEEVMITLQVMTIGAIIALFVFLLKFYGEFKEFMGEMKIHVRSCDRRFHALAQDYRTHLKET